MQRRGSLTFQQRFGLGVFVLIAGATFVFGIVSLRKSIILPLFRPANYFTIKTAEQLEEERLMKLRTEDTDSDGLSDYEELYVFRTSPYLEDSDSDGLLDGIEIAQQTDPNCPRDKTCGQTTTIDASNATIPKFTDFSETGSKATGAITAVTTTTETTTPTDQTGDVSPEEVVQVIEETFGDTSQLTPDAIGEKLEAMTSDELRAFLGKIGIPQELLAGTDDATIRALLKQTLSEMTQDGSVTQ